MCPGGGLGTISCNSAHVVIYGLTIEFREVHI